uniref:Metalloenzyme domain-containing protein n=1 Tax=Globodera pallida TaxID=36090 RepID=A0A183CRM6_GLOPA
MKISLERLIKVPPGIPNIATLPKGENPYRNVLVQLGAIACSSDDPGHELCGAVTLGELDPILGINPQLEGIAVKTPLQALLSAARNLVKTLVEGEAKFELILCSDQMGDQISTGNYPSEDDQKKALEVWVGNCDKARQALAKTKKLVARKLAENIEQFACIGDRGPMADVIRAFKPVVLSSRVPSVW